MADEKSLSGRLLAFMGRKPKPASLESDLRSRGYSDDQIPSVVARGESSLDAVPLQSEIDEEIARIDAAMQARERKPKLQSAFGGHNRKGAHYWDEHRDLDAVDDYDYLLRDSRDGKPFSGDVNSPNEINKRREDFRGFRTRLEDEVLTGRLRAPYDEHGFSDEEIVDQVAERRSLNPPSAPRTPGDDLDYGKIYRMLRERRSRTK